MAGWDLRGLKRKIRGHDQNTWFTWIKSPKINLKYY